MKYFENGGVIFRGTQAPGEAPYVREYLVGGQWKCCTAKEGLDAYSWGTPMTQEEAKEFEGQGWPVEDSVGESAVVPDAPAKP
jgi:hypothetical protein